MKNPYWTSEGQTHPISVDDIHRLCFEIVNIVAASAELASGELEIEQDSLIFQLQHAYAEKELCKKLLRLAVLVRTFDDIASSSTKADEYKDHAEKTSGEGQIGSLTAAGKDVGFNLREACNKIIHAQEIRVVYDDVIYDDAVYDDAARISADEVKRRWFCGGEVELKGAQNHKNWEATVYVCELAEIVLERVQFTF